MDSLSTSTAKQKLATPVQFLKGVGPQRAELLDRLDLRTARDLIFFFPRDYQDMSELRPIEQLEERRPVSVSGVVEEIDLRDTGRGRSVLGVLIRQGTQYLRAIWFNQPFMQARFAYGDRVLLSGTPRLQGLRWEMTHPRVEKLGHDEAPPAGHILPAYPLTEGIRQTQMRRLVHDVVDAYGDLVEEVLPQEYRDQYELMPIHEALREVHTPTTRLTLNAARRRFIFQELLVMQLALALKRAKLMRECRSAKLQVSRKIDARIRRLFPFELTDDQNQAISAIAADMAREVPMNRLLQGDVGSGKTVVAQYAMLLAVARGCQSVLMAPTEVLARQHARTFAVSLRHSKARIGLLASSVSGRQRRDTLRAIAEGQINLVIGTHAVLSEDVQFDRLGLVVIDEQHKFGVQQRARLRTAGLDPHYLVMTATPIPRSISMTLFGDLDVATLQQTPPGRQTVHTYLGGESRREKWWEFFRKKLREGRQGYVITPLVDPCLPSSEAGPTPLASAEETLERLVNGQLSEFRLDLVHGQQSATEKEAAMAAFRGGETQVLVATSVVEVGVDVPNATLMTIENGERFGLAQLHQLRGRISRGPFPGYLCVFAPDPTAEATQRLQQFCNCSDGFQLAEFDFAQRGPGDLFSVRQHGLPPLRIADLQRDREALQEARSAAQDLIAADPHLEDPRFERLRRMVTLRYGQALDLGDVG